MSKQYQVKQVETNSRGYKVTRTLSTDDVEEIKALIGSEKSNPTDSKKTSKSTKEFASNKNTKPGSKKDVVIDAEFTEVKGSKKSESKEAKSSGKKTKANPKALPAPKVKETKPKINKESGLSKSKNTIKAYYYIIDEEARMAVYAPNKAGADKLISYFCNKTGKHARFDSFVKKSKELHNTIEKHKLTIDNYYQIQIEAFENGIKRNWPKGLPRPSSQTKISALRQRIKVDNACLELIKKDPKIKYYGYSDGKNAHVFMYYGDIYNFASLPNAVKDFLNYKVWFEAGEVKTKKLSGQPKIKPKPKHPATKIKKVASRFNNNTYEFYNKKGEHVRVNISKHHEDPKNKNCLPNQWAKAGLIKKPIYNYLSADVIVTDVEGNCYGGYDPTTKDTHHINFDWLLEATPANETKLINEVYRLANL